MNIGLLRCDSALEELLPISGDYPEAFKRIFSAYAPDISLKIYDVQHGEFPSSLDECDGYISTGARYSVYDKQTWIIALLDFIKTLYKEKIKFAGICFGHQAIAEALDGSCGASENGWGVGVKQVTIVKKKKWMQPELESFNLLVSHMDQVLQLPSNSEVLGTNRHCPNSMIAVGDHFLGIQAHPEFTPQYIKGLMRSRVDRIGEETVEKAVKTLEMPLHTDIITRWIRNFFVME